MGMGYLLFPRFFMKDRCFSAWKTVLSDVLSGDMVIHPFDVIARIPYGQSDFGMPKRITDEQLIRESLAHPCDTIEIKDHLFEGFQSCRQVFCLRSCYGTVMKDRFDTKYRCLHILFDHRTLT